MAPKRKVLATLIAGAMAVAGWWLTSEFDASPSPSPLAVAPVSQAPDPAPAVAPLVAPKAVAPALPAPPTELVYRRFEANAASATPEICLYFSAPLQAGQPESYQPFLRFEPAPMPPIRVEESRLCFSGLSYGTEYSVTLRAGLPGQGGLKLADDSTLTLSLGDRPSVVSLGRGFWLPRSGDSSLPINSVNVDRLKVSIYRVGERALARTREMFLSDGNLGQYQVEDDLEKTATTVWSDTISLSGPRNQDVVTQFPLPDVVTKGAPGAYLVVAEKVLPDGSVDHDGYQVSGQWVIRSDLGLTTYHADNGLMVMVRSLASALPSVKTDLSLIAANSEILASLTTDANGTVTFPAGLMKGTGGMEPIMIVAHQGEDFNLLDLRGSSFDLSDRGVQGRDPAGPVDAFLYTERGIYRPGETVYLTGLIRNAQAVAIEESGTWFLKVLRPNGQELGTFPVKNLGNGAFSYALALPKTATLGMWDALLYSDPKGSAVGRVSFEVDTFVPQRLGVSLTAPAGVIGQGEAVEIPVEARFLYGAVGAGLGGEASLTLIPDSDPFPQYKGFRWGREDDKASPVVLPLEVPLTDEGGKTIVSGAVSEYPDSTRPLRGVVRVDIAEPGGRATSERVSMPVASAPLFVGIHPAFEGGSVREGSEALFEAMAVDRTGAPQGNQPLAYRITKIKTIWQWFSKYGSWSYQPVLREQVIANGSVTTDGTSGIAKIGQALPWGRYRLEVMQPETQAQASYSFYSGWYGETSEDRPDRLEVSSDKPAYAPGETIRLHIASDVAGEATVVIANESIHQTHLVSVPAGGADVSLTMGQDWAAGAYALVSFYRPQERLVGHAPIRSVGLVWLGAERASHALTVTMTPPAVMTPRQVLTVPLKISGAQGQAFVTVAAVDQGILNLTKFATPDPLDYYFRQRRLGVELVDDYGRIIRAQSAQGTDQGGDAGHGQGLETVPTRSVALFSGLVAVQADGSAQIPLEVPDFQGELRLMAVAFDRNKLGSAEQRVTVRDPVVADVILPRFMASGDDGRATVLLHNITGTAGDYHVTLTTEGPLSGGEAEKVVPLASGQRVVYTVPLSAHGNGQAALGVGTVRLRVHGPGFAIERDWPLEVRPAQVRVNSRSVGILQPGQTLSLQGDGVKTLIPGSVKGSLTLSRWLSLDVGGLLRSLSQYPYACLEQTTSRAMPLLSFKDTAEPLLQQHGRSVDPEINQAIDRITALQFGDEYGHLPGFALWSAQDYDGIPWLTAYAMDFLLRAAEKGYWVPAQTLEAGLKSLNALARRQDSEEVNATAYAMALLARRGQVDRQALTVFHDESKPSSVLALALMGSAFDAISDTARATDSYQEALHGWGRMKALRPQIEAAAAAVSDAYQKQDPKALANAQKHLKGLKGDYARYASGSSSWEQSEVAVLYRLIAALAGSNRLSEIPALLEDGSRLEVNPEALSTDEQAAMLLAASELARNAGHVAVSINGTPTGKGDPITQPLSEAELTAGVTVVNQGDGPVFYTLSQEGFPQEPLPAEDKGMALSKSFFTPTGEPVNPQDLHQNQRLVVVLDGSSSQGIRGDYALLDLLPAGWDAEGVVDASVPGFQWVGLTSELVSKTVSDDRVIAVVNLPESLTMMQQATDDDSDTPAAPPLSAEDRWKVRVAYVVRAVTPGRFALPAVIADHMRLAPVHGRSEMGAVLIAE